MIIRTYKKINHTSLLQAIKVAKKARGFVVIKGGVLAVKIGG